MERSGIIVDNSSPETPASREIGVHRGVEEKEVEHICCCGCAEEEEGLREERKEIKIPCMPECTEGQGNDL